MGDVSTGDSESAPRYRREYSVQLREYANHSLSEPEFNVYKSLFEEIKEKHHLETAEELMMLDMIVFDFLRIKRLHKNIRERGDMMEFEKKDGSSYVKANEASYLLNAVESQIRQNMKELLLTRKEATKKSLMMGDMDFASWINDRKAKVIDVETTKKEVSGMSSE